MDLKSNQQATHVATNTIKMKMKIRSGTGRSNENGHIWFWVLTMDIRKILKWRKKRGEGNLFRWTGRGEC